MQKRNKKKKSLIGHKEDLNSINRYTPKKIKNLAAKKKCIQIKRLISGKKIEVEQHTKSIRFSIIKWLKFSDHFFRTLLFIILK